MRRAFTLVELLVVIGIIALLAAVLTPMAMRSYRQADKQRAAADLNTIAMGLEAFKGEWGDYPRPDSAGSNSGFACLGRFLIGPHGNIASFTVPSAPYKVGDCQTAAPVPPETGPSQWVCVTPTSSAPTAPDWARQNFLDGKDGPGMKKPVGGRVYGPYLQADKFKTRGLAILDKNGNPILYFPARAAKSNINLADGYISDTGGSAFNMEDNDLFFIRPAEGTAHANAHARVQSSLGDISGNGGIDGGETALTNGAFILWAAGADGLYGPNSITSTSTAAEKGQAVPKCDDVIQ